MVSGCSEHSWSAAEPSFEGDGKWCSILNYQEKSQDPHSPAPTVPSLRCPQASPAQPYPKYIWTSLESINGGSLGNRFPIKLWWLVPRTPLTHLYSRLLACSDLYSLPDPQHLNSSLQIGFCHWYPTHLFLWNFLVSLHVLEICFDLPDPWPLAQEAL